MIRAYFWHLVASIACKPHVFGRLVHKAQETPYTHITSQDGKSLYMGRWWLFNGYGKDANGDPTPARWAWLPSVRIHHICRADSDRVLHDHPWNARTIILRGWYKEVRLIPEHMLANLYPATMIEHTRYEGYTGRLLFGEYHRITEVSPGGVWTIFITWKKRGTWGFLVDGKKVPWRQYLGIAP